MKKYKVTVSDLGLSLVTVISAMSAQEAEAKAREIYSVELDCFPEEVDVESVVEL